MPRTTTRRRGRSHAPAGPVQRPWRRLVNPYAPVAVLAEEDVERIHVAALRVLEELGIEFLDDEALDIAARGGADVDRASRCVRFDRGLVEESVAKAPPEVTLTARNPARSITVGGNHVNFTSVAGPPHCSDLERGRRAGTYADYCDLLRLIQSVDAVHSFGGFPVAPTDLPAETRHLDSYYGFITLTDRVWQASALGRVRINDAIDMVCIARGTDRDGLAVEPGLSSVVNANSPRRYDGPMLEAVIEMARAGQPTIITPFTLAGAMSPVTIAGALAQQNAEALAGVTLAQLVNPGAPVVYGGFTSNVDMKTGAPAFGTPEYAKAVLAGGQLARRYRLPYRSSNVNSANCVDAQAAYESEMSLWAAVMAHTNLVYHGVGWLEGGLTASFEKVIVDAEMLQMMAEVLQPLEVSEATLGLDAMAEVGPGGHFFGAAHTLERYQTAFYPPLLSDWRNFETWRDAGGFDATQRAHAIWKRLLADYAPPPIDPAVDDALKDFVARRKAEGGAPG